MGWLITGIAVGTLATACSGNEAPTAPSTTVTPTEVAVAIDEPTTDGTLRIGLLLPSSGAASEFGQPLFAGARLAGDEINAAGGVLGVAVELIEADEGEGSTATTVGLEELLADGVDVIVGPASSTSALATLRVAVEQSVVCSPTAAAIALAEFPDGGRFFRTIPSDSLQAQALADRVAQSGRNTVAVLFPDDQFGDDYRAVLARELAARGIEIVGSAAYDPASNDLDTVAQSALTDEPDLLALIGDAEAGGRMLAAIERVDELDTPIFITEALRRASLDASGTGPSDRLLRRVFGVGPLAVTGDRAFNRALVSHGADASVDFASYAFDCVVAAALAAEAAGTDRPEAVAAAMREVTSGGSRCTSFRECAAKLAEGFNVDYDGASGRIEFDATGDVSSAAISEFGFDLSGRDQSTAAVTIRP